MMCFCKYHSRGEIAGFWRFFLIFAHLFSRLLGNSPHLLRKMAHHGAKSTGENGTFRVVIGIDKIGSDAKPALRYSVESTG